jgi:hypothetical protein
MCENMRFVVQMKDYEICSRQGSNFKIHNVNNHGSTRMHGILNNQDGRETIICGPS